MFVNEPEELNIPERSNKPSATPHIIRFPELKEDNQLPREQACSRDIGKEDTERLDGPFSKRPDDIVDDFVCVCEE